MALFEELTDAELLEKLQEAKKRGITQKQLAKELGATQKSLGSKLYRIRKAQKEGDKYPDFDPKKIGKIREVNEGNYREFESNRPDIKTLEDLIRECEIDLDVWNIVRWESNKWATPRKRIEKDLKWAKGGIKEGYVRDYGDMFVQPIFQVKAWMVRKKPIALFPTIQPVNYTATIPKPQRKEERYLKSALILPDMQVGFIRDFRTNELIPFHDRLALSVALQIAYKYHFDLVLYMGDGLDLPDWTDKFLRAPEYRFNTQPAILELAWWLTQFRLATPDAEHKYLQGNHEFRMDSATQTHLNAAHDLRPANEMDLPPALSIPRLLGLHSLGIEWIDGYPDNEYWINQNLVAKHGNISKAPPGATAKAIVEKSSASTLFAHVHSIEWASRNINEMGETRIIKAVSPGCLCRIDYTVPGHKKGQNWQQGIGITHFDYSGFNSTEVVEIHEGKAIYGGVPFEGEDYLPQIREETRWEGF